MKTSKKNVLAPAQVPDEPQTLTAGVRYIRTLKSALKPALP